MLCRNSLALIIRNKMYVPASANRIALKRVLSIIAIVLLSFAVRAGTSHFMGERLDDAGWFQYGSYKIFDQRAHDILDRKEPIFFITDSSRTDLIQYPPAFPMLIALIYSASGEHSSYAVLR